MQSFTTESLREKATSVRAGDEILLSGVIYTARDAAHKRFLTLLEAGENLPFPLEGSFIYYAGPTPARPGKVCGSFGPTTSCRMDGFAPSLYDRGLFATIGKGGRNENVRQAIVRNQGLYLLAIGGAGALCAGHIVSLEEIAFQELGCESVKKIVFCDFPLYVGIDTCGDTIFDKKG